MQPVWVPRLGDYVRLAARVLGLAPDTVGRFPNLPLADSALHAPFAEFGGTSAYVGISTQAAVLVARLAQNHPLPDGNKRAAFLLTVRFLDANGLVWSAENADLDVAMVESIASSSASHGEIVAWIESRTTPA